MSFSNALLFIFALLVLPADEANYEKISLDTESITLCSGIEIETPPRCTGSAYCNACKNCKYCGHCNSGGSCGVCTRMTKPKTKTYKTYTPPSSSSKSRSNSSSSNSSKPKYNNEQNNTTFSTPKVKTEIYIVTKSTSFRSKATHESSVLKRFKAGDQVVLLERTNKHWWKVSHGGQIGWVKKALLVRK